MSNWRIRSSISQHSYAYLEESDFRRQLVTNLFKIVLCVRAEKQLTVMLMRGVQRPSFDYIKCQDYLNFQNKVPHLYACLYDNVGTLHRVLNDQHGN